MGAAERPADDPEPAAAAGDGAPRVRRHRGRQLVVRTLVRAWDDNIFSESAAAAFWQTLSLPPLLLGLFGVLSYVGDLYGPDCTTCPYAESIPPKDPLRVRDNDWLARAFTLQDMQGWVTQAEDHGGGWVPMVFHEICYPGQANFGTCMNA